MRISDWSSDVCSSDLLVKRHQGVERAFVLDGEIVRAALAVPICQCASPAQLGVSTWEWIEAASGLSRASVGRGLSILAKIGRASGRGRECQYVSISVVAVSFKKTKYSYIKNTN